MSRKQSEFQLHMMSGFLDGISVELDDGRKEIARKYAEELRNIAEELHLADQKSRKNALKEILKLPGWQEVADILAHTYDTMKIVNLRDAVIEALQQDTKE